MVSEPGQKSADAVLRERMCLEGAQLSSLSKVHSREMTACECDHIQEGPRGSRFLPIDWDWDLEDRS